MGVDSWTRTQHSPLHKPGRSCRRLPSPVRLQIIYSGRVQNVGFRAAALHIARSHPVTGWVRNDHAGTVWLQAQGTPGEVEAFLAELAERMAGKITAAERQTIDQVPGEQAFIITY